MSVAVASAWLAPDSDAVRNIEEALGTARIGVEIVGTIAFAVSAALLAGRRQMNLAGVIVFGTLVATGGGTIRDVLLGNLPVYWIEEPFNLLVAALAAAATMLLARARTWARVERYDVVGVFDAAGLALFTVVGTTVALDVGAGAASAVVIGVISGSGGGILRDVIARRVPAAFASGHIYLTAAITGAALAVAVLETDISTTIGSALAVLYIFVLRLLAIHFNWGLPKFTVPADVMAPGED